MASRRASDTWKRFAAWYGADALERKYGLSPPVDWCEILDSLDGDELARVMTEVRAKFPTWMPGLPEFESLVRQLRKPAPLRGPSVQEQLKEFVVSNYSLTFAQLRGPWTFLGSGNPYTGEGFAITGVMIPADGDVPGYRVTVQDMAAGRAA